MPPADSSVRRTPAGSSSWVTSRANTPSRRAIASTSRYREVGFRTVLSETPDAYCQSISIDTPTTWDELRKRLSADDAPTAIFSYNDDVARRAAAEILAAGLSIPGDVSLVGFGTFSVTKRAARGGRNPRTGAAIRIKAAKVPKFRPGKALKDALN